MEKGNTVKTVVVIITCIIVLIAILAGLYLVTSKLEETTQTSANTIFYRQDSEKNSIQEAENNKIHNDVKSMNRIEGEE